MRVETNDMRTNDMPPPPADRGVSMNPASAALAALLLAALALGAAPAQATSEQVNDWRQACTDAWDDSPADDYCTGQTIEVVTGGSTSGHCVVSRANCSVTASVTEGGETATKTLTDTMTGNASQNATETASLTACIWHSIVDGWNIDVRKSCLSHQTAAATAVSDGLSLD